MLFVTTWLTPSLVHQPLFFGNLLHVQAGDEGKQMEGRHAVVGFAAANQLNHDPLSKTKGGQGCDKAESVVSLCCFTN